MVMHARKPQRVGDGYFEKHQTHPYQKYSDSKNDRRNPSEYISGENRFTTPRSPNGNTSHGHSSHTSHSNHHHHFGQAADDRGYARSSYSQKASEKERDRDRDYKSSRNKYTDVRSPKEKRGKDSEKEISNHERSETEKTSRSCGMNVSACKSNKYDKRSAPSASWSLGSEWSEHISSSGKRYYYNSISEVSQWEKPREWDSRRTSSKDLAYSSRNNRDKRSSSRTGRSESEKFSKRTTNSSDRYWNNCDRNDDERDRGRPKHSAVSEGMEGQSLQDMDISPDRGTPLSENSYGVKETTVVKNNSENNAVPPIVVLDNSNQRSGSLLAAALPRIVATPNPATTVMSTGSGLVNVPANNGGALSPSCETSTPGGDTPHRDAGPPTPTHSENTDPHAPSQHLDHALPRRMECLGSYSSVVGGNLHYVPPMLTPSLVNYVRADLTAHVIGWPADILEKQANKFTEEAYQLGCLQCTRVSAELKCSRSLVRHTEIQATLQEQKIMYLRQQISRLEVLKSQSSFMSED